MLANAGRGLGKSFLDQDYDAVRRLIDTNVTGTIDLIQKVGRDMRQNGRERILITGSIGGDGTTVTCLMPGVTETDFFEIADMMDTKAGTSKKDSPVMVAEKGFQAMMNGEGNVVTGWHNKLVTAIANVTPAGLLADAHRGKAQPGTAKH